MEWGYTRYGGRRHILAETFKGEEATYAGIALCGILLTKKFSDNSKPALWLPCQNCETLLSEEEA
jgi:hypothetical protein